MIEAIEEFQDRPRFHIRRSIEAFNFLGLMRGAKALIGNSSGGIIEAPYLQLPFILVGERQDGRDMAANVRPVVADAAAIRAALDEVQGPAFRAAMGEDKEPFGDGHACERIFRVLKETDLNSALFRKRITY